jgi:hypothetical protein
MKKLLSVLFLSLALNVSGQEIETWSPPVSISTSGVDSSDPHIAMDAAGNAVALWLENDTLVSKALPLGMDWSSSSTLADSGASASQLVVDPAGNATAIWVESTVINVATKPFGSSWSSATTLSASGSSSPPIAVDSSGDLVAIWVTSGSIQSATKIISMSWSSPTTLSSSGDSPQIAISDDGTVAAVWHSVNAVTSVDNILSATKTLTGSWSASSTVSNPALHSVKPQVALDTSGNALAVWNTYELVDSQYLNVILQSSTLPSGGSWSSPIDISLAGTMDPAKLITKVVFTGTGYAIVVWTTADEAIFNVFSSQTQDRLNWISPVFVAQDLYAYTADVVINSAGDGFIIYMATDPDTGNVAISTGEANVGSVNSGFWTFPVILSNSADNGFPKITAVAVGGANAYVAAAWVNYNGTNTNIQSSTGSGMLVIPPSGLMVSQSVNDFGVFQEYYNSLTWTASTDPDLLNYAITRNGILLGFVAPGDLLYVDHNQVQDGNVTYGVTTVNTSGSISATETVSFP